MLLADLKYTADKAQADMTKQDKYVLLLGDKISNGEKTIEVYSDNIWTTVKLVDFWNIQHDKYLALSSYAGDLAGLHLNLQSTLDEAMKGIAPPEER